MAGGKFGGGVGTLANPYLIEDVDDLNEVRRNLTASFKLVNNINLGIAPHNTGSGWTPIAGAYTGTFDGNGKVILNLFINRGTTDSVGLFDLFNGTVKDLGFINPNVTGRDNVGVLAGRNEVGTDTNRLFIKSGNVTGRNRVGSIVGSQTSSHSYYNDCKIECNVTGTGTQYIGGLIGLFSGNASSSDRYIYFISCIYSGVITGSSINASGHRFNGFANFSSTNSYYNSTVSGTIASNALVAKTQTELQTPATYTSWETRLITSHGTSSLNNTNIWTLSSGTFAKMYNEVENRSMILVNGTDYKTWNGTAWVTKYTTLPTREQFLADGIKDLSSISQAAWILLKSETSVEIVNFVDNTLGSNSTAVTESLAIDAAASTLNRNVLKKTFNFSNYGSAITKIQGISI